MVLKTKCREHIIDGSLDDFSHDAAYAHAILKAVAEHDPDSDYQFHTEWFHVRERAAEIMTEWGFTEPDMLPDPWRNKE